MMQCCLFVVLCLHTSAFGLDTSIGSDDGLCAEDQCGTNNNSSSGANMLQISTNQRLLTAATQTPREYQSVGFGQCSFEDGSYKSLGWTTTNCPQGPASCTTITPCSVDQCKADCDSMPSECSALAYHEGHCFLFVPGFVEGTSTPVYYTKTTEDFKFYECFAVAAPTTTTTSTTTGMSTTTTARCQMYSEDQCRLASLALNLTLGSPGHEFADSGYTTKGCYTYTSGEFKGSAYYGLGGTLYSNNGVTTEPKIRVPGHDCKPFCFPYSEAACFRTGILGGYNIGGKGYDFAAKSHSTKGCYTYTSGSYKGYIYYGTGSGKSGEIQAPLSEPKTRPPGYDCA